MTSRTAAATGADPGTAGGASRRRPRDRRDHVVRHARILFAERGFHAVRMEDIATAVGVTARALYRHFPNKYALLAHVSVTGQDTYFAALDAEPGWPELAARLVRTNLDDPTHSLLWQREARHLEPAERGPVQRRVVEIATGVGAVIARDRDDRPGPVETETLAWSALAVAASQGGRPRCDDRLLTAAVLGLGRLPLPGPDVVGPQPFHRTPEPTSRRERLLHHAATLFRRHGYLGVTLGEIGERAGIHGPSIYHHFPSKMAILQTLLARLDEWVTLGLLDAQGRGTDPGQVLDLFGENYVGLALRFPDLVSVALTESIHLSDADAEARDAGVLVTGWSELLRAARPELDPAEAATLVRAARSGVDDLVRIAHLRSAGIGAQLVATTRTVLATQVPGTAG
ncbi:TetR/AcrR family transcriptional regulator [Pseudonocardia sp. NPDC049635]|uniref:TetR/AcrR family transcriptional regulator n=1 Tax=Pseudonocardia sp. NPDC049635 TaxID=3155506 RepID=UPI0033D9BD15